jgi:hypothetical protein
VKLTVKCVRPLLGIQHEWNALCSFIVTTATREDVHVIHSEIKIRFLFKTFQMKRVS